MHINGGAAQPRLAQNGRDPGPQRLQLAGRARPERAGPGGAGPGRPGGGPRPASWSRPAGDSGGPSGPGGPCGPGGIDPGRAGSGSRATGDAERTRQSWQSDYRTMLTQVGQSLEQFSQLINQQAQEQEDVSN